MENVQIRVEKGIKINVNDAGDYIVANVNDNAFVEKFYNMIEKIENVSKEMKKIQIDPEDVEAGRDYVKIVEENTRVITDEIDKLFGENSCAKVFGQGVSPTGYAIADFFDQLIPIFEKYADERQKKISSRYTRRRKGNSHV